MLVYGDHSERVDPREALETLSEQLARISAMGAGLNRHSALVGSFIEAGRLLQGVADADFADAGHDRRTPEVDALTAFLRELAEAARASWESGFKAELRLPFVPELAHLPPQVEVKVPEGYAFYALYPEAYLEAARLLVLTGPPCVIGIRSIGTSLGAIVAAALGTRRLHTMRPCGEAFDRRVAISDELAGELLSGAPHYVIVDEGPGLSGSSFGGVADWLEDHGVPLERIAFMPSHPAAPGPRASDTHRQRWQRAQKAVADLGPQLAGLLRRWVTGLLGPVEGPLEDLSAGAWRRLVYSEAKHWPAVNPGWERRKYLARAGGETWLLRFAGLGAIGEAKLARARMLHGVGFVPEPRGLLHGFLVERWHGEAARPGAAEKPIAEVARYIGARARLLPAKERGASLAELLAMAKRNGTLALGEGAAKTLERWQTRLAGLEKKVVPTETDNRLDRHEWLRLPDGRLLKADALDHQAAHDLIGCQDLAWDVAGATIEFDLDEREAALLAALSGRAAGQLVDPELLLFFTMAYAAFRLGHARLSMDMCAADRAEWARLNARATAYERHSRAAEVHATQQDSLIGLQAE